MIPLKRPVVFLDLEATGVWPEKDRIIEVALIKLFPDGKEELFHTKINPEMKIPAESIEIHHITDQDVKDAPTFKQVAAKIKQFLDGSDLGGFGMDRLDIPLFQKEFRLADIPFDASKFRLLDAKKIFMIKEPRDLETACRFYLNKPLENAHLGATK